MKKVKAFIFIFLSLILTYIPIPINAQDNDMIITPYFEYIKTNFWDLKISSSGNASISAELNSYDSNKLKIIATLQCKQNGSWATIKTFTEETTSETLSLGSSYSVKKGYEYRAKFEFYVYYKNDIETTTEYCYYDY